MRIKPVFLGAILFASLPSSAHRVDSHPPADRAVEQPVVDDGLRSLSESYKGALERLDLAALKAIHNDGVVIFESGERNVGWDAYEKGHIGPELRALKSFHFTKWEESARVVGTMGLIVADMSYAVEARDGKRRDATGVVTLVATRDQGAWKIIHSHWSTRAKPA